MPSNPRSPDQIIISMRRKRLALAEAAIIPACRQICSAWHNAFGACYRLDDDRFRAIAHWLLAEPPVPADHLLAAIASYQSYCQANAAARLKAGIKNRDLVSFLRCSDLEGYIEKGLDARRRQAGQQRVASAAADEIADKRDLFAAIAAARQDVGALHRKAVISFDGAIDDTSLNNPRVRARMREMLGERPATSDQRSGRLE